MTSEAGSSILNFGRHRGETLESVYRGDASYCKWLLAQVDLLSADQRAYLESKRTNDGFVMPWGKYRGRPLSQVAIVDPGYIDFLRRSRLGKEEGSDLFVALAKLKAD